MAEERIIRSIEERLATLAAAQGIDLATLGPATVRAAIRTRLRERGCECKAYLPLLESAGDEARALLETLLVPETWFFRDEPAFELFRQVVSERARQSSAECPFRVLSLACSTGEEVWSVAIALCEGGLQPSRFRVDGLEFNRNAVAAARAGRYDRHSFRGAALGDRAKYFRELDDGRRTVIDALRDSVTVTAGNLLEPVWTQVYDVVFCRNVLIYMTPDARRRAMARARSALVPGGVLFVGHADASVAAAAGFRRHPVAGAFAWVHPESPAPAGAASPGAVSRRPRALPRSSSGVNVPQPPVPPSTPRKTADGPRQDQLDAIRSLADRGLYAEAEAFCREFVRRRPLDGDGFGLLGLIAMAMGRSDEAIVHLRRALYLSPEHAEWRALLALICRTGAEVRQSRAAGRPAPKPGPRG